MNPSINFHVVDIGIRACVVEEFIDSLYSQSLQITVDNAGEIAMLCDYWSYDPIELLNELLKFSRQVYPCIPECHALNVFLSNDSRFQKVWNYCGSLRVLA